MTTYKEAGVDIDLADKFVELIKPHVERTHKRWHHQTKFLSGNGGFAAIMEACGVIIGASADGVGEKGRIAWLTNRLDSIGQDLVAMSANDLWATMEPEATFFLDYYATGKLSLNDGVRIVAGIADACKKCGAALVGGETAEMSISFDPKKWDIAGSVFGVAKPGSCVASNPKRDIRPGMKVWGYPSNGLHSNGYTLVHKVFCLDGDEDEARAKLAEFYPELGCTLGEELMRPTTLYPHLISSIRYRIDRCIGGFAHITGGGPLRNIRRILPLDCTAVVNMAAIKRRPIFDLIEEKGNVKWLEMHRTFNCGVGLIAVTSADLDSWGFVHMGDIKAGSFGGRNLVLYSA